MGWFWLRVSYEVVVKILAGKKKKKKILAGAAVI